MLSDTQNSHNIIGSDEVEGTAVYAVDGRHIGSVNKLLIEKTSGRVTDAVLSVGGLFGLGSKMHSMPWPKLEYDTDLRGYRLDVTEDALKNAPTFSDEDAGDIYTADYQSGVYDYWGVERRW